MDLGEIAHKMYMEEHERMKSLAISVQILPNGTLLAHESEHWI